MSTRLTKPVFDAEKNIAALPNQLASVSQVQILGGAAAVSIIILLSVLRDPQKSFAILVGSGIVFVMTFLVGRLVRWNAALRPALMISDKMIIFPGFFSDTYVDWDKVFKIERYYWSSGNRFLPIDTNFKLILKDGGKVRFSLPYLNWRDRDRFFFILRRISESRGFHLDFSEPEAWHDDHD